MTQAQEEALQELNDKWGVAVWREDDDGDVMVVLDDGDAAVIEPDGSWDDPC